MVGIIKICNNIYISSIDKICNAEIANNNISKIIAICDYKKCAALPTTISKHYIYCGSSLYDSFESIFTLINQKNVLITCQSGVRALCVAVALLMVNDRISMQIACEIVYNIKPFAFDYGLLNDLIEWENFLSVEKTLCYDCMAPISRHPTQVFKNKSVFRCVDCAIDKQYVETDYAYYTTDVTSKNKQPNDIYSKCVVTDTCDLSETLLDIDCDIKNPLTVVPNLLEKMQHGKLFIACKHRPILVLIDFFAQLQHYKTKIFDNAKELNMIANSAMRRFLVKNNGGMYEFEMCLWLLVREFFVNYFTISGHIKKSVLVNGCSIIQKRCFMEELAIGNYFDFPSELCRSAKCLEPILETPQSKINHAKPKQGPLFNIIRNFDEMQFSKITSGTMNHPRHK